MTGLVAFGTVYVSGARGIGNRDYLSALKHRSGKNSTLCPSPNPVIPFASRYRLRPACLRLSGDRRRKRTGQRSSSLYGGPQSLHCALLALETAEGRVDLLWWGG
jgi:hypothetical protein